MTIEELYKYGRDEKDHLFVNEYNINPSDPEKVVYEYSDGTGGIAYYTSETCRYEYTWNGSSYSAGSTIESGCTSDYADSDVKKVIDNWSNSFSGDLKEVNGYKARILNLNDLFDHLGYQLSTTGTYRTIHSEDDAYDWLVGYKDYQYWTMDAFEDSDNLIYTVTHYRGEVLKQSLLNGYGVRPVINLKKCALGDKDGECLACENGYHQVSKKITKYNKYNIGDEIEYKGQKYYVIENSDNDKNYVTLLKDIPLSENQIKIYKNNEYEDEIGFVQYYTGDGCYLFNNSDKVSKYEGCKSDYKDSNVKIVVDNWVSNFLNESDLKEVDGYKARLITKNEFNEIIRYSFVDRSIGYRYWTMSPAEYYSRFVAVYGTLWNEDVLRYLPYEKMAVKPVINLLKEKAGDQEEYKIGDVVTYRDEMYHVIKNSDINTDYVVLLKVEPLKESQINLNDIGISPYYKGENCNSGNLTQCTTDYKKSNIKTIVDNWVSNELDEKDLVEIDGYKARLITTDELVENLGYDYNNVVSKAVLSLTDSVPNWAYDYNYSYWTMSGYDDINYFVYRVLYNGVVTSGENYEQTKIYDSSAIRPVINLNKCAFEGGCWEEEVQVAECNGSNVAGEDDSKTTVDAGNTLSTTSTIIIIASIIFIIGGLSVLLFNYNKSRKEKKDIENNTN